ncbi:MAG: hypothetical protein WC763_06225 [Candidatus Paceibacterota bacterium]
MYTISIHDLARRLGANLPSVAWIKRNDIALKKWKTFAYDAKLGH